MGANLARKILAAHLVEGRLHPGDEIGIRVDQVLAQDLTATQAFLQFEAMDLPRVRCKLAVCYADHYVLHISPENMEDHLYLQTAARKYGVWFSKPASGIGHQIHLEHFAVPGEIVLGADSHTPHCGGVGMIAVGAGGMDVAIAMAGGPYYFDTPQVVRVNLTGALRPWSTAKDVILELLRRLTVRGGRGRIFEFVGSGLRGLNAQQRVTITNMSYELGATTSIFPSDDITRDHFRRLDREQDWREALPDADATYDDSLDLDLGAIEPLVALPSLPDRAVPVREAAGIKIDQVMVGSCTNGSYSDLRAVAQIVKGHRVHPAVYFFLHPSSRSDLELLAREGYVADLLAAGVNVAEPTCGACIGFGHVPAPGTRSLRAINRNFKGRSGLAADQVYLASVETAAATALTGVITDPRDLGVDAPAPTLPEGIARDSPDLIPPAGEQEAESLTLHRGESIQPPPIKGPLEDTISGPVLIKVGDDISTDDIMPVGAEAVAQRSNVHKLADYVFHRMDPTFSRRAKASGGGFVVGGENYGQGSAREHAALAPMYLGVKAVLAKSFSRIHHANLINWGVIPLLFADPADYDALAQGDMLEISGLHALFRSAEPGLTVRNASQGTEFAARVDLNARERSYLLAGGRLARYKIAGTRGEGAQFIPIRRTKTGG